MKDGYTFVTLDNDVVTTGDAVFVDIDASVAGGFVQVDETYTYDADFIMVDDSIGDIDFTSDINEADLSIVV